MEFDKIELILFKEYFKECKVRESNQKPNIIITNNKNIFFANNGYQKIWILKEYKNFCLKSKR